jgi:hypothetical protein
VQTSSFIKEAAAVGVRMADDGLTETQKDAICVKYITNLLSKIWMPVFLILLYKFV